MKQKPLTCSKWTLLFFSVTLLFLSGCATWTRLSAKEYVDRKRYFQAVTPQDWMRYNLQQDFIMTKDGVVLDSIIVKRFKFEEDLEYTKKKFKENMLPQDMAEVAADNLRANTETFDFTLLKNEPVEIDGHAGYQINYAYKTQNGLKVSGIECGFFNKKYVYRIRYEAATTYYFDRLKPDFDAFLKSFQVI